MTESILGIIFGAGLAVYCMVRSWQTYRKAVDTRESRVVTLIVSILFAMLGTYMASCTWRELMGVINGG